MNYAGPFNFTFSGDLDAGPVGGEAHGHAASASIVVDDANLLFTGDFKRASLDLVLSKDGQQHVVADYFKGAARAALSSPDGAQLSGDLVKALVGEVQVAQLGGGANAAAQVIGTVSKLTGSATAIRNGVSVMLNIGDNVQKGDVVQAGSDSSMGITFVDGTVFGLSSNARMVLNEMVYDPAGSSNSSLLSLVQGTITFVAGETAKNGNMKVDTPVATMGIRGTAVLVEIGFEVPGQGNAPPVKFQVLVEPGGHTGSYVLYSKSDPTLVIGTVNQAGQVTSVAGNGDTSTGQADLLTPMAQAIIQQTLQQYFPGYVPNANPRSNGGGNGSSTPPDPLNNQNDKLPNLKIDQPNVVPINLPGTTPDAPPTTVAVTITPRNMAPTVQVTAIEVTLPVDKTSFKLADQVTITDPDATNPAFLDPAVPYVAGTGHVVSAIGPGHGPAGTALAGLIIVDPQSGAVSYDPAAFKYLAAGETAIFTIAFDSRSGPDTLHETVTLTVNGVNDAPVIQSAHLSVVEGGVVVLSSADIVVVDPDGSSLTFKVSNVLHGTFQVTLDGIHWSDATTFTTAALNAGHVRFVHDGGELPPSFIIQADDGAAVNNISNIALGSVTFSNVDDAPVIISASLAVTQGGTTVIQLANIAIVDPDSSSFTFHASATHGTFERFDGQSWTAIGADNPVTSADVAAGHIRFHHDGSSVAPEITVTADDGSAASAPFAATIVFVPLPVVPNIAPVVLASLTVGEGGTTILTASDIHVSDPDSSSFIFKISNATHGAFQVAADGLNWSDASTFTSADLAAGHVRFVHDGGEAPPTFSIQADDGQATSNPVSGSVIFTNQNDAPLLTSASFTVSEGGSVLLTAAEFAVIDPDSSSFIFKISNATHGAFQVAADGLNWSDASTFTSADLAAGHVRFVHDGGEAPPTFSIQADDGAAANHLGNIIAGTVSFENVNDAPVITSAALTVPQDGTVVIHLSDIAITDPDSSSFDFYAIASHGVFERYDIEMQRWDTISADDRVTSDDIGLGLIRFHHDGSSVAPDITLYVSDGDAFSDAFHVAVDFTQTGSSFHLASSVGTNVDISQYGATNGFVLPGAGNATTPGTPEDRIVLGYDAGESHVVLSGAPMVDDLGLTPISNTVTHHSDGSTSVATVLGAGDGVTLTQTITLGADANFFTTTIDIFNNTDATIDNVRFLRNIDPDQDAQRYGDFSDYEDVIHNPNGSSTDPNDTAIVSATGPHSGAHVALIGLGADWRASVFGYTNNNPYDSKAYDHPVDPNGALLNQGVALTYDFSQIAAGGHATATFITTNNVATEGSNALFGTEGADIINGHGGNDLLIGLGGADNFVFTANSGHDTIYDFKSNTDHIDLSAVVETSDLSAWMAQHVAASPVNSGDTLISLDSGDSILLHNVAHLDLRASDLIVHNTLLV